MKMSILDKSNCFRGILLLIGQDLQISSAEREFLLDLGKRLDFEKRFCENAIEELLENRYLDRTPPRFSHRVIAEAALLISIRVARTDGDVHATEHAWLKSIAETNGLEPGWLENEITIARKEGRPARMFRELELFL